MFEKYLGFYSWEGDPCRVYRDEDSGEVLAEIYVGGIGFRTVDPGDVMMEATPISEVRFKELVQQEIILNRKHNG